MCRWMQIMSIMWFAPDTPVVSVEQRSDGVHKVSFRNVGRLCVMLKTAGSRFLLHFNETHLMCCRIAQLDGVMTCYIMDTCAVELKHHVPVMLEVSTVSKTPLVYGRTTNMNYYVSRSRSCMHVKYCQT
jgi:hypothetical protein